MPFNAIVWLGYVQVRRHAKMMAMAKNSWHVHPTSKAGAGDTALQNRDASKYWD